jgi:hypothetical protein
MATSSAGPRAHLCSQLELCGSLEPRRDAWRLLGAPRMQEVDGFDKRDYPLHAAALAEWSGFMFVAKAPAC